MLSRILVPTDLSHESNSVLPWGVTVAQAFGAKLYLLHVMSPNSVNEPERLEDFPHLSRIFAAERGAADMPPLKASVPVAKMYLYHKSAAKVILDTAKSKQVELICLAATNNGVNFAWWSAGKTIEHIVKNAPCSVLCLRGQPTKEKDWKRPRFRHVLLLAEMNPHGISPVTKLMPWIERFNSMLHIFPLHSSKLKETGEQSTLREICQLDAARTNVLLFNKPHNRIENLLNFIGETPIDLIVMTPRTRAAFSNRLVSDIFVRLLRVTASPILLLR